MAVRKMLVCVVTIAAAVTTAACGTKTQVASDSDIPLYQPPASGHSAHHGDGSGDQSPSRQPQGATLTRANFSSKLSSATSRVRSVHMVMYLEAAGQSATMDGDVAIDDPAAMQHLSPREQLQHLRLQMAMDAPGQGSMQMRVVNGSFYLQGANLGLSSTSEKPWVRLDAASSAMSAAIDSLPATSPSQIAALHGISQVTKLGPATVKGVPATEYRVRMDTSKATALFGAASSSLSQLPRTLDADVWVDSNCRPIRISMDVATVSIDIEMSRWNKPVHIVAPPASQVTTLAR